MSSSEPTWLPILVEEILGHLQQAGIPPADVQGRLRAGEDLRDLVREAKLEKRIHIGIGLYIPVVQRILRGTMRPTDIDPDGYLTDEGKVEESAPRIRQPSDWSCSGNQPKMRGLSPWQMEPALLPVRHSGYRSVLHQGRRNSA